VILDQHTEDVKWSLAMNDIYTWMLEHDFFEYGRVIEAKDFRELFGIVLPEVGTYKDFKEVELKELQCVGFCRDKLLKQGKYLTQDKDTYRVLLPSENKTQVESYMTSADRKLKRAILLSKNTPQSVKNMSGVRAIAELKRESIRERLTA